MFRQLYIMYFFVLHIVILSHVCCCKNMLHVCVSLKKIRGGGLSYNATHLCKIAVSVCVCVRVLILSEKPTQHHLTRQIQAWPGLALISLN